MTSERDGATHEVFGAEQQKDKAAGELEDSHHRERVPLINRRDDAAGAAPLASGRKREGCGGPVAERLVAGP